MTEGDRFKGLEIELYRCSGARVLRVVHPERQDIAAHKHDRAYIGIYTLGRYRELYDGGEAEMAGPCAVLHPAGRPHADVIGDAGLETLTVEFDPAWLRLRGFDFRLDRSRLWKGGHAALAAGHLARAVTSQAATEVHMAEATAAFLTRALAAPETARPNWIDCVEDQLDQPAPGSTIDIARQLDLNAAWLARAYRMTVGEGIHETVRRRRVERACAMLRRTALSLADVAIEAGFCDQAHMNRCFKSVLGRTPLTIRGERQVAHAAQARP